MLYSFICSVIGTAIVTQPSQRPRKQAYSDCLHAASHFFFADAFFLPPFLACGLAFDLPLCFCNSCNFASSSSTLASSSSLPSSLSCADDLHVRAWSNLQL